ncbi:MAG TPA: flagellar hook-basal body complex protein FliE [Candidatus Krumholzibacteria bacterium]|nr:flagellar hook-basal body complex protein FliE [Candidatus Krumholzibacteria bacterium]HPD71631.1 flagellar hook-basal body complex protein FliE [Candidatus Krumholzibacteria bacterium]HRY41436.1 flagellar hook-basal body complex protein FliE [Candidatus Krumholzibacteria bacterium]
MAVGGIRALGSIDPRLAYAGQAAPTPRTSFGEQLQAAIREVDGLQVARDVMTEGMVRGEPTEVHEIMTAAEEAQLAFELMLEVRNKLLEAYQEIMRMQV